MHIAVGLLLIGIGSVAGAAAARRFGQSAPLLLCLVGILVSFVPGVPHVEVSREVVLLGLLPPLLYATATRTSLVEIKANIRGIAMLSVGLVLLTAIGVALVVWWLLDVPFAIALAVGGVVAPPDAVAATAVARRIGLPRRIVTLLEGESLFNDATALVTVRMALVAAAGSVSVVHIGLSFLWAAAGGILVGILAAAVLKRVRLRVSDVRTDTALSFITPWLAYLPAEAMDASGVLAVVVAGLLLGHSAPLFQQATARRSERTYTATVQFLLENAVFLLIGLQAESIVEHVTAFHDDLGRVILTCVAVFLTVIVLRFVGVVPSAVILQRTRSLPVRARGAVVVAWAGMRGVVTLAAAFTIPADAPQREVLILIALAVTAGTLLLQGSTLPMVARACDVRGPDPREDALQLATVLQHAAEAGQDWLDVHADETDAEVVQRVRQRSDMHVHGVWERLGNAGAESPIAAYQRMRRGMLQAERAEVLRLRAAGDVEAAVIAEALDGLDLEESMLTTIEERGQRYSQAAIVAPEGVRGDCQHLRDSPDYVDPRTPDGCEECLTEGREWVHLRLCLTCGHVGCCDSSPGRHADRHFHASDHPVMRSFEPGEEWRWCYVDTITG